MTEHSRVGTQTKTIACIVAAMVPVAAVTASAVVWKWEFALLYVAIAFCLQALVRLKNPGAERFAHILVLSGSAPIVVPSYFGDALTAVGVVNVVAVLVVAIGVGYLLAGRVRPQARRQGSSV
jgi:hypothetical protein